MIKQLCTKAFTRPDIFAAFVIFSAIFLFSNLTLAQEYIVGEGDILEVTVYEHEDLTTVDRVSGDGAIRFPLIGQVQVAGLSVKEITQKIASILNEDYIVLPQVNVFIKEFRSQKTVIMGEISKPGLYELKGQTSFLELLSMAGGLTKEAGDSAIIKRKKGGPGGENSSITIDLLSLLDDSDLALDVMVQDGDTIIISKAGVFYVSGEVKKPDSYTYIEGTTVIQAITIAGGFTPRASATRLKVIRKLEGGGEEVIKKIRMDDLVLPDDVIVVPEGFF